MSYKVAFLDRDGTINIDHGYVYKLEDFEFVDKAIDGMKNLQDAGFIVGIVTNQSGIGQGLYTEDDMNDLHAHMVKELALAGIAIETIAYCPHARDAGCACRKPKPAMVENIARTINGDVDLSKSWVIGDKEADMMMGKAAGTKTALIRSRYWQEDKLEEKPDLIVDSLYEASLAIREDSYPAQGTGKSGFTKTRRRKTGNGEWVV